MGYCAVIAAAGMSSRMGGFKPLMDVNGFKMIEMAAAGAEGGGAEKVFIIAGNRGSDIAAAMEGSGAEIIFSPAFDRLDMLSSVKLGLEAAGAFGGAYVLPADAPLAAPRTYAALEAAAREKSAAAFVPVCSGGGGHPALIKRGAFEKILAYSGENGLKGALAALDCARVAVSDPAALLDADTPADMEALRLAARRRRGMAPALCEELYNEAELPEHIRAHCRAVGALSAEMARKLIKCGYRLDIELCRSGGALHDIRRLEPAHPLAGGRFLRERGWWALAHVVAAHNGFEGVDEPDFDESAIVCLADKLLQEDSRVTLARRYESAREKFPPHSPIGVTIREDEKKCRRLAEKYLMLTGESLE